MRIIIGKDRDLCTTTCPKCKSSNIEVENENMHPYSATIICKSCNETTLIHGRMLDPYGLTYFYTGPLNNPTHIRNKKMISKELLSEVFNCNIDEYSINENILYFIDFSKDLPQDNINFYELAHKCKEWADTKYKACLISGKCKDFGYMCFSDNPFNLQYIHKIETQKASNEPEAIFKACQWILDNVKTNSLS